MFCMRGCLFEGGGGLSSIQGGGGGGGVIEDLLYMCKVPTSL